MRDVSFEFVKLIVLNGAEFLGSAEKITPTLSALFMYSWTNKY